MKNIFIALLVIVAIGLGWYLLSPLLKNKTLDDESPIFLHVVDDALDDMDKETRAEFDVAVTEANSIVEEENDPMPVVESSNPVVLAGGVFMPRAHDVSGEALLIQADGEQILRFEDFETTNGPNLHIYLSSDLGAKDFIDLGEIRATKGNVNYEIPKGVDTKKYNKVLVWCVPFRVLFSYAELK